MAKLIEVQFRTENDCAHPDCPASGCEEPRWWVVSQPDSTTALVKSETKPSGYLQGPFASIDEAEDADWDAQLAQLHHQLL
jgi:hypothetical protein